MICVPSCAKLTSQLVPGDMVIYDKIVSLVIGISERNEHSRYVLLFPINDTGKLYNCPAGVSARWNCLW